MTNLEMLEKWAKYTEYDPQQTSFNLLSVNYELNKICKKMTLLTEYFDATGDMALIYAKHMYAELLKKVKFTVEDYLNDPHLLDDEKEIYDMFRSETMNNIECRFEKNINSVVEKVVGKKMIDGESSSSGLLFNYIDRLTELTECKTELFLRGGKYVSVADNVHPYICVFDTLAQCLLTLEQEKDGIYLCYVNYFGAAEGFFGFFVKSNGNIISVNERIDEQYVGQFGNFRNARHTETKKYKLFPYEFIFNYTDYDYKGYATKHQIDMEQLAFSQMNPEAYMPLVLSAIFLNERFTQFNFDEASKVYINSLLPQNIKPLLEKEKNTDLMVIDSSALLIFNSSVQFDFETEKILNGEYDKLFNNGTEENKGYRYDEVGYFTGQNQFLVDLWGKGFKPDLSKLLKNNTLLLLADNREKPDSFSFDFVANERKMQLEAYRQIRVQLKEYIEERMNEAYQEFGGWEAVRKWYEDALKRNKERIERLCVQKVLSVENKESSKESVTFYSYSIRSDISSTINYYADTKEITNMPAPTIISKRDSHKWAWYDEETGAKCSIAFAFFPRTWEEVEEYIGEEVPDIIKGWRKRDHYAGNSILNTVDPVSMIKHPLSEKQRFRFSVAFSKRTWKKIKEKYEKCVSDEE